MKTEIINDHTSVEITLTKDEADKLLRYMKGEDDGDSSCGAVAFDLTEKLDAFVNS